MPTEPAQVRTPKVKKCIERGAPQPSVVTMCWPAVGQQGPTGAPRHVAQTLIKSQAQHKHVPPHAVKNNRVQNEQLKRKSSRFWRASMAQRCWVCMCMWLKSVPACREGQQGPKGVAEAHEQPLLARPHGTALLGVHRQEPGALAPQGRRGGREEPARRQAQERPRSKGRQSQEAFCWAW